MSSSKTYLYISIFLAIIAIPFILEISKPQASANEIVFWQYWSGTEKEPLEKLVQNFNSENHGFKVKMLTVSMARKKILMSIAGGVPPDLMHLDGDMVTDFALRGALVDLESTVNGQRSTVDGNTVHKDSVHRSPFTVDHFIPIYLKMLNINGHQYAMPLTPSCEAMHVNKGLLNKYGLEVPGTLDDIVEVFDKLEARSLKLNGNTKNSNPQHPTPKTQDLNEIAWLPSWPPWSGKFIVSAFGGDWHTANSPENIAAWTWVQENFARKIPKGKLAAYTEGFQSYQSPDNPFYAGRIAIENSGVWEYNLAGIFAPKMEVVVVPFPVNGTRSTVNGNTNKGNSVERSPLTVHPLSTQVSVDALAIPRGAKHPEQALEFMQWLLQQENLEYLALAQKKFTPLKNHSAEFFSKHANPYIRVFIDLANSHNATYFPQVAYANRYKRDIKEAYLKVLRMEASPKEALDELRIKQIS